MQLSATRSQPQKSEERKKGMNGEEKPKQWWRERNEYLLYEMAKPCCCLDVIDTEVTYRRSSEGASGRHKN